MIGMASAVSRDVLPFSKVYGSPLRRHGVNAYVLRKLGVDEGVLEAVLRAFERDVVDLGPFASDPLIGHLISEWNAFGIDSAATVRSV